MKNRIKKSIDCIIIDDGIDGGPWVRLTWDNDGTLQIDSFDVPILTPKTVRELTAWLADSQIAHQQRAPKGKAKRLKEAGETT